MVENSSAGLAMLRPEVTVTVTGEEDHQAVLARYHVAPGRQRHVVVALGGCRISSGKHRGKQAIEVRLDGARVGELTYLMSQRYGTVVAQVSSRGGRPGCEAVIQRGPRGLELTLCMPRHADGAVPLPVTAPDEFGGSAAATAVLTPVPAAAPAKRPGVFSSHKPAWIAAAVVAVAFFGTIGAIGNDDEPSQAADRGVVTTTTTPPPITTTTTTTTTTTLAPTTTTAVPVVPEPVVPQPDPVTPTQEEPAPPPPAPACDPNYTGCVPIASDVDCAGGSGNGPEYANGPINVIGADIYDLDNDKDGVACE